MRHYDAAWCSSTWRPIAATAAFFWPQHPDKQGMGEPTDLDARCRVRTSDILLVRQALYR